MDGTRRYGVQAVAGSLPGDIPMKDINVLSLVKGEETYVFLYSDGQRAECLQTLGRFAGNPELRFTWYDAAILSQKIRVEAESTSRF